MPFIMRATILCAFIPLTACSGVMTIPDSETAPRSAPATVQTIQFPPTWTPTMQPQPSATPLPDSTLEPELGDALEIDLQDATPVAPSLSTESWQRVEGSTASFMLPRSFEPLDMGSEFGLLMAALMTGLTESMMDFANELGQELGAPPATPAVIDLSEIDSAFQIDFVLAMEDDQSASAFLFSEPLEKPSSLGKEIRAALNEQENPVEIISLERLVGSEYETGRMSLLTTDSDTGEKGQVLLYIILLSERVYQLGYATDVERFDEFLPIFETSASTFRVSP